MHFDSIDEKMVFINGKLSELQSVNRRIIELNRRPGKRRKTKSSKVYRSISLGCRVVLLALEIKRASATPLTKFKKGSILFSQGTKPN